MNARRLAVRILLAATVTAAAAPPAGAVIEVTLGTQFWNQSEPEAKYREFTDPPQGSFLYSLFLEQGKDRNLLTIYSVNALQDDQRTGLRWTNGARYRIDVAYQEIPHNFSQVSRSSYTDAGQGRLILDNTIQALNQANPTQYTNIMSTYLAASPDVGMRTRTDAFAATGKARPAQGWRVAAAYEQRKKTGKKAYGGSFGLSHTVEVWEPTEQRMTDGQLAANFQKNQFTFRAVAGVSIFENLVGELTWDNPKRLTDTTNSAGAGAGLNSAAGKIDLYPDNTAWRGELAVAWVLPRRTSLAAALRVNRHEQSDDWLPYTVNSALTDPNLPANALPGTGTDAQATAITGDFRLTTRALGPVGASLRARYNEFDNQTESFTFPGYVRADQAWVAGALTTHPFGNKQVKLAGELNYRPVSRLYLEAGADWTDREHTLREIEEDEEAGAYGRVRLRLAQALSVEAEYRYANRVGSDIDLEYYENAAGTAFIEPVELRRYDVANRRAQIGEFGLDWGPAAWVQTHLEYRYERDNYPDTEIGLRDATRQLGLLDVMLPVSERFELGGGGGYGHYEADQQSRSSGATISTNPNDNWSALLLDRNWFAYADFTWWMQEDKLALEGAYEFSWARGEYYLDNPTNTAQDLPDTRTMRHIAMATLRYDVWDDTEVGLRYAFDDYDVVDFANQGIELLNTAGSPPLANAIFLGDNALSYSANRVALYLTQSF